MPASPDNSGATCAGARSCAHCGLPVPAAPLHSRTVRPDDVAFCCAGCRMVHSLLRTQQDEQTINSAMLRIGLGVFFSMNLMVFSFCFYGAETLVPAAQPSSGDAALDGLFRWLLLLLASGVMLTLWSQLAHGAWDDLRRGLPAAGVLITIGVLAAYAVSAISVVRGQGPLYFDSASMILLLVTIGQYLEAKMKTAAVRSAEGRLLNLPDHASLETPEGERLVPVSEAAIGDVVRIRAGQAVPVDGEIVEGEATLDTSLLTGEAEGQRCAVGDAVWAGSHVVEGFLRVRIRCAASHRRIESIVGQLHALRSQPAHVQRLADRVAAVFVPGTLLLALAVFAQQWLSHDSPMEGLMRALAVALIACPCALGLTAPLVISRIAASLAQRGIVVRSARALELAASVRTVLFDKTGTLTTGDFRIERTINRDPRIDVQSIAAALERASRHPIARAWAGVDDAALPAVSSTSPVSGLGVSGTIGGHRWFIGRPGAEQSSSAPPGIADSPSLLPVVLTRNGEAVAWFALAESIRPEAEVVIEHLRSMGLRAEVLTGDASPRAVRLAVTLGVMVRSGMTPQSKREAIRTERAATRRPVAFVGDGINDALALAEADLGLTVAGGSDLAHASGQVSLLEGDLHRLVVLLHAARAARRRIALSLTWSFGYNSIGLTLAAMGLLTPVFAAVAMVVSSAVTIVVAARPIDRSLDRSTCGRSQNRARSPLAVSRGVDVGGVAAAVAEARPA